MLCTKKCVICCEKAQKNDYFINCTTNAPTKIPQEIAAKTAPTKCLSDDSLFINEGVIHDDTKNTHPIMFNTDHVLICLLFYFVD